MKRILLFVIYMLLIIGFPLLIFSLRIPDSIINDTVIYYMYYFFTFISFQFGITIGYFKLDNYLKEK